MTTGFGKTWFALPAAFVFWAAWLSSGQALELTDEKPVGEILSELGAETQALTAKAATSAEPAHWSAVARLAGAQANLELLFEERLDEEFEDLDEAERELLIALAAAAGEVEAGEEPDALDGIQDGIARLIEERLDRPMAQVLGWSPHAAFIDANARLVLTVKGANFDKSYYEPVLVVTDKTGAEEWLPPKKNSARELTYEVPAKFFEISDRRIQRFDAAVEFTVQTGGFFGMMKEEKNWRNRISALLLPSKFVNVAGTAMVEQPKQELWQTSAQVCHSNEGEPSRHTVKHECFQPQPGFAIDLASAPYAIERELRASGGRPSGGCEIAVDAGHAATPERVCLACNPVPGGGGESATACAKARWKEVQTAAAASEVQLDRFSLDGRNPSRLIILPAGNNGRFSLQLTYFTGETVEATGPYQDAWVQVIPRPQRNAVEVRMKQQVLFD